MYTLTVRNQTIGKRDTIEAAITLATEWTGAHFEDVTIWQQDILVGFLKVGSGVCLLHEEIYRPAVCLAAGTGDDDADADDCINLDWLAKDHPRPGS